MKKMKMRFLSSLAITLFILIFLPLTSVNVTGKVRISKNTIQLEQGEKTILKIKGVDNKAKIK